MLTGLLFSRAFCQPSRVTAGTMGPMEGTNWTVGSCICSHWLCGPLLCYWPLCGHHGYSWDVPRNGFCHLPPHPPLAVPPHTALPPIPPTPSIINADGRKGWQKYHEIQPSEIEEISNNKNQYITKYFATQHVDKIQG